MASPPPEKAIKLRNYVPEEGEDGAAFEHQKISAAKVPEAGVGDPEQGEGQVDQGDEEDEILGVAPKKANWDLKRDVATKLKKLERRTQESMIKLMRSEEEKRQEKLIKGGGE
eukprot:CAMPEP_0198234790 /NCGR_PEP_ID=MMETSP1446-20131203/698_1 /TAXON_ID=1461542 ORGANISM="Unidentified sp, Strain CCMP2111" /NCGR_SAMPLE_ID=MMETSP1446 /ASSEMBLY_ACC=CAM_ASM_001112 /LENGTH=112 /DNA_ID=CAMNT_0043915611 /DNA_START=26 /DNA_END=364 /DNA_ORIENTATION=-